MSGRDEMLERIRKALGRPHREPAQTPTPRLSTPTELGSVMPPIAPEDFVPTFEAELQKLAGSTHRATTRDQLHEILRRILAEAQATGVVLSRNPLLARLSLAERLRAQGKSVAVWPADAGRAVVEDENAAFREHSFAAEVGITGVDFAVAETGSLVLSSLSEGSQLASLAPPVHVALYRRGQVLGFLDQVLEGLAIGHGANSSSPGRSVVFVTGPSRTADIEQVLIRGVHGPRHVHAILVEEACLAEPRAKGSP